MPARVRRIISATLNNARLVAGSSRWRQPSSVRNDTGTPNSGTVSPRPLEGSQPSITENTMISIRPTQNVGSEKPRIEPAMIVRPLAESGLSPAHRPSGMPSTIANSIATLASSSVAGMRSKMRPSADVLCTNECPRSPCSASRRNTTYCIHNG